jgi:hypothetical protein
MDSIDSQDFEGLTEDVINEERQEYIIYTCDLGMTDNVTGTSAIGVVTWP